jgi:hypothetical protein
MVTAAPAPPAGRSEMGKKPRDRKTNNVQLFNETKDLLDQVAALETAATGERVTPAELAEMAGLRAWLVERKRRNVELLAAGVRKGRRQPG